jgi:hypothetical protein
VRPFPPEDRLERLDTHALVELGILRNLLVALEFLLPLGVVERRDDTVDRLPFGDRQAGFGKPRGTADQHQRKQHQEHDIKPAANQRPIVQVAVAGNVWRSGG